MLGCDHSTCSKVAPVALAFCRVVNQEIPSESAYNRACQEQPPESVPIGLKAFHPRAKDDKQHSCYEQQQEPDFSVHEADETTAPPPDTQRGRCMTQSQGASKAGYRMVRRMEAANWVTAAATVVIAIFAILQSVVPCQTAVTRRRDHRPDASELAWHKLSKSW